ncbi:ornithine cyclodeaminase, partial [Aromatoleum toluclasticum]|nr:ornithine cyclodeaminase [Aromatoleum toluclasticum]
DSVGFALEDFSALRFMRDLAIELGVDEEISLIPDLADPKNMFGSVPVSAAPHAAVRELQAA